jgi:hypothetical protein
MGQNRCGMGDLPKASGNPLWCQTNFRYFIHYLRIFFAFAFSSHLRRAPANKVRIRAETALPLFII